MTAFSALAWLVLFPPAAVGAAVAYLLWKRYRETHPKPPPRIFRDDDEW